MSKDLIYQRVDEIASDLFAVSDYIHANPEVGHQEFKAQARLVAEFEQRGFVVEKGIGGFETSFKATLPQSKDGPTVVFIAEYDALPELGHGCGHNLICTAALGAATVIKSIIEQENLAGNVVVFGTPAEEVPPPVKGKMVEQGIFDDVDVVMISHGRDLTCTGGDLLAIDAMDFHFTGKASHAAANPEDGISALDAALLTMHGIEMLREHVRSDIRVHGVVTDGGQVANVVPEKASLRYYVRGLDRPYLETVVARVENCARAGALATGAEVSITSLGKWDTRLNVAALNELLQENARQAGAQRIKPHPPSLGSADFGNVTHRVPAATLYIELVPEGTSLHTKEVVVAAGGEPGRKVIKIGAKAMASSAYELFTKPELLAQIKQEFSDIKGDN